MTTDDGELPEFGMMELPDTLFHVPDDYGTDLQEAYLVINHNLRIEAQHLALTTIQTLLIERIAYNYCSLRYREANGGFDTDASGRSLNTFWLTMTQEFNRLVYQSSTVERDALTHKFAVVVKDVLATLADPEEKRELQTSFQDAFDRAEL